MKYYYWYVFKLKLRSKRMLIKWLRSRKMAMQNQETITSSHTWPNIGKLNDKKVKREE